MDIAPDGSPIDLSLLLPERGEGEFVAEAVPSGASILELGCGVGRVTRQLVERGFRVTAVDESSAMLAHVRDAELIHAAWGSSTSGAASTPRCSPATCSASSPRCVWRSSTRAFGTPIWR